MKKKPAPKINLTADRIHNAPAPQKGRSYLYDAKVKGLRIQITAKGGKTWQHYCWVAGLGAHTHTIGPWPTISIPAARKRATEVAGKLALDGPEAAQELRKKPTSDQRFADLFKVWYAMAQRRGDRDIKNVESRYDNHIEPTLGRKHVEALTPEYLQSWFDRLSQRKKIQGKGVLSPTTANRCLEIVKAVFASQPGPNPAAGISKHRQDSRERYLAGSELKRLFAALETAPRDLHDLVLLALSTGARSSNLMGMRWADLDLDLGLWVIPAPMSKNKSSMGIPLIPEAVEILRNRKNDSPFVFPAKSKTGHIVDIRKAWAALLARAQITQFVFHDLRRTAGSWQALTGASELLIAKSLGHRSTASTAVYARIRDANPVRLAMGAGFAAMREAADKL